MSIARGMKTAIAFLCLLLFQGQPIVSKDIYVAPGGEGKELGTSTHPFCSIRAALTAALKFAGREPVDILLNDGVYYLDSTLVIGPGLSGTGEYPVGKN